MSTWLVVMRIVFADPACASWRLCQKAACRRATGVWPGCDDGVGLYSRAGQFPGGECQSLPGAGPGCGVTRGGCAITSPTGAREI